MVVEEPSFAERDRMSTLKKTEIISWIRKATIKMTLATAF
jgi:hypothetical protein